MFAKLKAALANLLGRSEAEVHALVTAIEQDAVPLLDNARAGLVADVKVLVTEAVADAKHLDSEALADIKAELAALRALLGNQPAPAPAEPPAGS